MASAKTRKLLVDVARSVFAKKGFEDTTMNDIALASGKGRRTLYTYFKNLDEVYYAVIEEEIELMIERLKDVEVKNLNPEDKLLQLIYTHLSLAREVVNRNGNLRAEFFRDIWRVEKVRKKFDLTERDLIARTLMEGMRSGQFDVMDVRLCVDIIHYCIKGLEVPYIFGRLGAGGASYSRPVVQRILHRALTKMEEKTDKETK
ncbi:MAG: TetR/AcrR family transcriptional regulator [Prevotellaceae bacterium]|nr:TetR/AcrR family transcriptional regulator [Prevotellaceae bacterium]